MEGPRSTQQLPPLSASHVDDVWGKEWAEHITLAAGQHPTFQLTVQCCPNGLLLVRSHITVWAELQRLARLCADDCCLSGQLDSPAG